MDEASTGSEARNHNEPESCRIRTSHGATHSKKQNQPFALSFDAFPRRIQTPANLGISILAIVTLGAFLAAPAPSQQMSSLERDEAFEMLDAVAKLVQEYYYDQTFHGVDWDAKVREARDKIRAENSLDMSIAHIAAALDSLNDSHTVLIPPPRVDEYDHGYGTLMVGDTCYISQVRPGSDAEAKGLKRGDEVLSINGVKPTRDNLWKIDYIFRILRPQVVLHVTVRNLAGQEHQAEVAAKIIRPMVLTEHDLNWNNARAAAASHLIMDARTTEMGQALMILKPQNVFNQDKIDKLIGKARKHQALIVDLRGNPGGALIYFLGGIFASDVKIADRVGRKEMKPEAAKGRGSKAFTGRLLVLIDSQSASAAEIFARIVQLQKRGLVVGDRSSGRVMEAVVWRGHLGAIGYVPLLLRGTFIYDYPVGTETTLPYGISITVSDLIMSDGKSLERKGVTPDEIVLPSAQDMANGRDPVLSRAATLLGVKLSPEDAGKLFPFKWPKD